MLPLKFFFPLLVTSCLVVPQQATAANWQNISVSSSPADSGQEKGNANNGKNTAASSQHKRYIVKLKSRPKARKARTQAALEQIVPTAAGSVHRHIPRFDMLAVSVDDNGYQMLLQNPQVERVEPDHKRYLFSQHTPYGISMVQADLLPDLHAGNVKVCIIDSGYDLNHEDLNQNSVTGTDLLGSGQWYEDTNNHGTHVAGTIAAINNDLGVLGVAPNGAINLHIVRVFDENGEAYISDIMDGLAQCVSPEAGADVINMSFGSTYQSSIDAQTFQEIADSGVLLVAAAGNDGNTNKSYPASYDSVISVAAINQFKNRASFSQQNDQVELSAPGVSVLSTVPTDSTSTTFSWSQLFIENEFYASQTMDGSPAGDVLAPLADCGIGDSPCPDAEDKICLIERGDYFFWEKVLACENGGGIGAILYNNLDGSFSGTLNGVETLIPSVSLSREDGLFLLGAIGTQAHLDVGTATYSSYRTMSGTSMATPHVAGVGALVWSYYHDTCVAADVRQALTQSAEDLGDPGRDNSYGFGLVQAEAAKLYLEATCGGSNASRADQDKEDDVDGADLLLFATALASQESPADLDRDGFIAAKDVEAFATAFGSF